MDRERFRRVMSVFERVRDLPVGERDAEMRRLCAPDDGLLQEVQGLLAHDQSPVEASRGTDAGGRGARILAAELARGEERESRTVPERIGRYRILRLIGEGGMGAVYEAEQDQPRRIVAVKVLRSMFASRELRRRFEYKAQILGRLQHPGIAQVIEAGTAELGGVEQPYIVMELVRGLRLDEYARSANLSVRDRLVLFQRICEAVHHAHQKGVIHRDLKPGNILVVHREPGTAGSGSATSSSGRRGSEAIGQPKVLDFGLAKLTDADVTLASMATEAGRIQGTLAYMSPEQARGAADEIDVRSDVYALGVILFQLVSGETPYDVTKLAFPEAVRLICESPPRRLTASGRVLRGDLETIVFKALEKDPARRYSSAAALMEDIGRYLSDQPIPARRPSASYQLRKLMVRQNCRLPSLPRCLSWCWRLGCG